jgi:hypothetical protein
VRFHLCLPAFVCLSPGGGGGGRSALHDQHMNNCPESELDLPEGYCGSARLEFEHHSRVRLRIVGAHALQQRLHLLIQEHLITQILP